MSFYTWTRDLEIGIAAVDDDHRKLISLIDDLHEAMAKGKAKELLAKTLDELIHYTRHHFRREEELMRHARYAGYEQHKQEHDALVKQVTDLRDTYRSGNTMLTVKTAAFLRDWLSNHILKTDKQYGSSLLGE